MDRNAKEKIKDELASHLAEVDTVIVTDFQGLNVASMDQLRRKVSEAGGSYQVVKNTLLRLAAKGTDAEKLSELYAGNNALGTTKEDPVSLAKALVDFTKENEMLSIKGGVLSGKVLDLSQIQSIATLPSREVLLAMMLGAMNAVPTGLVRVLNGVMANFVYALVAIKDQKEQA